jgi:hypothetical protein
VAYGGLILWFVSGCLCALHDATCNMFLITVSHHQCLWERCDQTQRALIGYPSFIILPTLFRQLSLRNTFLFYP